MFRTRFQFIPAMITLAAVGGLVFAQRLPQPRPLLPMQPTAVTDPDDDAEVLARGPVHEAFASTAEMPVGGGPIVVKRPPDPIEELPPDQKPEGDNVQWIPGYWHWDDERNDFIWVSGFWRSAPPGRIWVPGGWHEVRGGFQWVHGFWNVATRGVQQAQIEYLPPPPASLETGPTIVSPGDDYFYTPGCWVYRVNRYVWRPGFYVPHRPNWCWVPDHYRWTPCGYVFVPGFWDCPLERRGVLFAPVYFRPAVFHRHRFVYTPMYAVPAPCLHTSLFVRPGDCSYYFGDYFEQRYVTAGYTSWAAASFRGSNFAVTVGVGRGFTYDPLWNYYSVCHRHEPTWQLNIATVYAGRYKGDIPRPPRTLVQQNTVVNNVTNVTNVTNNTNVIVNNITNNTNVINKPATPAAAAPVAILAPLKDLKQASPTVTLKPVKAEDREKEQMLARELRQVATERRKAETQLVNSGAVVTKLDDKARQAKVELPPTVVARAQLPTDPMIAPPPPAAPGQKKVEPPAKIPLASDPTPVVKPVIPTTTAQPTQPKLDPKPLPKVDPKPIANPTPAAPVAPKVDPKPVVNPVVPTPGTSKVDPKPVFDPVKPVAPKAPIPAAPAVPTVPAVAPKPADPKPAVKPAVVPTPVSVVNPPKPTDLPKQPVASPAVQPLPGGTKLEPKSPPVVPKFDPPQVVTPATPPPTTPAPMAKPATPTVITPPPTPKVDPKPVVPPPLPNVNPPKPTPAAAPPKVDLPKSTPPAATFRSARPTEVKKDEKKDEKKK